MTQSFQLETRGRKFAEGLWVVMYLWHADNDDWQLVGWDISIISVEELISGKVRGALLQPGRGHGADKSDRLRCLPAACIWII